MHLSDQHSTHISRVLISVSDKTGLLNQASALKIIDVETLSAGVKEKTLRESGVNARYIT
ncbi:MAG: hypothetical protein TECD_00047 [Hyphomicrobiaceae bacterium hypho_1]